VSEEVAGPVPMRNREVGEIDGTDRRDERSDRDPSAGVRSAIYEGTVRHRRPGPDGHRFDQDVRMVLIELEATPDLCALHPLWSARHPAPVWVRRADYLGDPAVSLSTAVRDVVEERAGTRPAGPIALLTNPRTWGWLFNPISCYFCFDPGGTHVEHMVAEVTNTPWGERHCYVVGPPGVHRLTKALHVSPFLPMNLDYRLEYSEPGEVLEVNFSVSGPEGPQLYAGMDLNRRRAERRSLGGLVWTPNGGTIGVTVGIYRQALALWRKGVRFYRHPDRTTIPNRPRGGHDG
jgi:uncharacterized protein